jgi:hypothetical protein
MAIAVGTVASSETTGATGTITLAVTVAGVDRYLGLFISGYNVGGSIDETSVTYNGDAFAPLWSTDGFGFGSLLFMRGYGIVNPDTGTNNVSLAITATATRLFLGAIPFTGVNQASPIGTPNTATGASTTATVNIVSAVGALVWDGVMAQWTDSDPGAGQTERWSIPDAGEGVFAGGSTEDGAASVTMSWTRTVAGFTDQWGIGGVSLNPAAAAAPTFRSSLPLMGVGR